MSLESYHSNPRKAVFDHVHFLAASLSHLGLILHSLYFLFLYTPRNNSVLIFSLGHSWDMNKAWILHSFWMTPCVPSINSYTWFYNKVLVSQAVVLRIWSKNFLASSALSRFPIFHGVGCLHSGGLRTLTQEKGNPDSIVIIEKLLTLPEYFLCTSSLST